MDRVSRHYFTREIVGEDDTARFIGYLFFLIELVPPANLHDNQTTDITFETWTHLTVIIAFVINFKRLEIRIETDQRTCLGIFA